MFNMPEGGTVDSLEEWLAVHYGHRVWTEYTVAAIQCRQCGRLLVCFPRKHHD